MATLHLLSHSPFSDDRLTSCLRLLGPGDALLLTGDAVYALTKGTEPRQRLESLDASNSLFVLQEDVLARGLTDLPDQAQAVDYARFVELCCRFDRVNSWL